MTHGATLGAHAVQHAVQRAGVDPAEVEDVIMGCAFAEGATGGNIARAIALRAGLPVTTSGMTINRFCVVRAADHRHSPRSAYHRGRARSMWPAASKASPACRTRATRTC